MPPPSKVRSLGKELSFRLALLTFCGLALVSAIVYIATAVQLDDRQTSQLLQYKKLVEHLAAEHSRAHEADLFNHKLDDLFGGRADISLTLKTAADVPTYASKSSIGGSRRTYQFMLATGSDDQARTTAILTLSTQRDDQLLRHLALTLFIVALGGASIVSTCGFFLVRCGLAPVGHLVRQVKAIPTSRIHTQLDGSLQPVELQPLVEQFNALLHRLDQAYEQQKGFNADVAHELRTPLANMTANSELALISSADQQALRDALESNLEELGRMTTIISDMLFLAQADRGEEARKSQTSSLLNELRNVLVYYEETLEEADLRITTEGDAAGEYDISLLRRAISNLVENAARHATKGSVILLRLLREGTNTVIEVENTGSPIPPEQLDRIFQRFYRIAENHSNHRRNHGLGLSIVAAIARMHGGQAFAHSSETTTRIGLRLPTHANSPKLL
ncbi:heavy metal sensor histidine kinase [Pigmentiphaga sp. GD03639]|uniref:heavy metal sensor histidine kinase n=1 Tax=unclassified Pigmentiphaga TaxID=2626614 RepID=UPI000B422BBA|nr:MULTISPECIES: heavy metal sensor histidine kinase [unclassified Pigmentiphaga]MDH2240162.1 heavy metal sensor histidine kinase [Pigmentiphaga sp. GD03639]OVZ58348.1 hypothetical protein CDO46_26635 [Pigmentiphaga sp. NML030171]